MLALGWVVSYWLLHVDLFVQCVECVPFLFRGDRFEHCRVWRRGRIWRSWRRPGTISHSRQAIFWSHVFILFALCTITLLCHLHYFLKLLLLFMCYVYLDIPKYEWLFWYLITLPLVAWWLVSYPCCSLVHHNKTLGWDPLENTLFKELLKNLG